MANRFNLKDNEFAAIKEYAKIIKDTCSMYNTSESDVVYGPATGLRQYPNWDEFVTALSDHAKIISKKYAYGGGVRLQKKYISIIKRMCREAQ